MTRSLRIALMSTGSPEASGAELTVTELARELRSLGHRPTVFALDDVPLSSGNDSSGGSGRLRLGQAPMSHDRFSVLRHAGAAWAQIAGLDDLDLVQVDFPEAIPFTKLGRAPVVATVHHDRDASLLEHYAAYPEVAFVAVSRRQAELAWEIPFRAVIHHGLDVERYQLGKGGRRFVCFGISPESGAHLAIEAARLTRASLALGGAPGAIDHMKKVELLASSRALLAPLQWEEPLGYLMIESMLVGTPVIAYACGAAPEIVEDGITGFLVHDVDEMCRRMREVAGLDRKACRTRARSRWSAARMARKYSALYDEAIDAWRARSRPRPPPQRAVVEVGVRVSARTGATPSVDRSGIITVADKDGIDGALDMFSARRPSEGARPRAR